MPNFVGALHGRNVLHAIDLQAEALAPLLLAGHGLPAAGHLGVWAPDDLPQVLQLVLPLAHQAFYLLQLPPRERERGAGPSPKYLTVRKYLSIMKITHRYM